MGGPPVETWHPESIRIDEFMIGVTVLALWLVLLGNIGPFTDTLRLYYGFIE